MRKSYIVLSVLTDTTFLPLITVRITVEKNMIGDVDCYERLIFLTIGHESATLDLYFVGA
jgi:hypothetical protein